LHFPEALQWAVTELENYIEAETIPIGIKSSSNEKIGSKDDSSSESPCQIHKPIEAFV